MKRRFVLLILIIAFCATLLSERKEEYSVVDEDGRDVLLTIFYPRLSKYSNKINLKSADYDNTFFFKDKYQLNIYKFVYGRLNDENRADIVFGVYNKAPHHRVMARRMFAYNIVDGRLAAKFRCSRFITPMIDFTLYDFDGDGFDEVVTIERYKNNYSLNIYKQYNLKIERISTLALEKPADKLLLENGVYIIEDNIKRQVDFKNKEVILK